MKILIATESSEFIGELEHNKFSKSLMEQLPIKVKIDDYAGMEKIFYPPFNLVEPDKGAGYKPSLGDITYYAPWGNIAIFYNEFSHASGLIYLGKIVSGTDRIKNELSGQVLIKTLE